jgi:putative tricarboxylic transport membrane protein
VRKTALAAIAGLSTIALVACSGSDGGSGDGSSSGGSAEAPDAVSIIVPADPGGGWDQTGRALAQTFTGDDIVGSAPVENIGGAGGANGLAALANEKDPWTLMITGLVMVGAVETNASQVRIEDTTPIARLTEEPLVIVVPADSEYQTLEQLVTAIEDEGQAVSITGGSAGGADHILAGLVLEAAGLSSEEIAANLNYVPNSGGGEAVSLIIGGQASVGISGVGEFVQHIESGDMRALAVSSEEPVEALPDVPTITDEGYDVVLTNWRGVLAPGDITDQERTELERLVAEAHESESWTTELETRGWTDAYLPGAEFDEFLTGNISEVTTTLKNIGLVE